MFTKASLSPERRILLFRATLYCIRPSSACSGVTVILAPSVTTLCLPASSFTFFNCATLTASVSSLPAATLVIWRVILFAVSPTETAPFVEVQVDSCPVGMVSGANSPRAPFSLSATRFATEPTPIATPLSASTVVPFPIATALFALTLLLFPKEITFSRSPNVLWSPMTIVDWIFLALLLEPMIDVWVALVTSFL